MIKVAFFGACIYITTCVLIKVSLYCHAISACSIRVQMSFCYCAQQKEIFCLNEVAFYLPRIRTPYIADPIAFLLAQKRFFCVSIVLIFY